MTAMRRTASDDRGIDPVVELAWEACSGVVSEVEEELTVSLRAGQPRVYDAHNLRIPAQGGLCDLSCHSRSPLARRGDAPLADLGPPCLELRLDQHDRLPARSGQGEGRRQRLPDGDEGHVAGDELRCERELGELAGVHPLEDGDTRLVAQPRV